MPQTERVRNVSLVILVCFVFFKHYNLDHKVRNSLDEVFVLRVIPLYDFSSLQTFKNSLHGRMPLKAPCSETDVLGGRGGGCWSAVL